MKIKFVLLLVLVLILSCKPQNQIDFESNKNDFLQEQIAFGKPIWNYLYSNPYRLNVLNESKFTAKIDSLKNIYLEHLLEYQGKLDQKTFNDEILGIDSAFDKYILEYPQNHENFTGMKTVLSEKNKSRLDRISQNFNELNNYSNEAFEKYVHSYIVIESNRKLRNGLYNGIDNQQLTANWHTIDSVFTNQNVIDYWKEKFLVSHIDEMGVKNIDRFYSDVIKSGKSSESLSKLRDLYISHKTARESNIIETYKSVGGFDLDMHISLPNDSIYPGKRPTLVHFHGGSWSIGTPEWFSDAGKEYAKRGWVVAAVEYRIKGRHGTYPFEAVRDAKSAIRWLRENSNLYNIDSSKIVATGNSAGGHLSIATALVDNWNEESDNLKISAIPNAVMVNSAVYDLTVNNARWITEYNENKELVKEISPNDLITKTSTKFLLIHGENDKRCLYSTAVSFYEKMKSVGNSVELYKINDAEHFIWFGNYPEVGKITQEFIEKLNL